MNIDLFIILFFVVGMPLLLAILFVIFCIIDGILKRVGTYKVIRICNKTLELHGNENMTEYGIGILEGKQQMANLILKILKEDYTK